MEKVAKLCADFKSGIETVFVNKVNQQETIEIDDSVRQAEYKYTYSDSSNTTLKSEQADILVTAVERFAQKLNLNLEEIFIWYFEQKGVDNPERFLGVQNEQSEQVDPSQMAGMLPALQGGTSNPAGSVELPQFMQEGEQNPDITGLLTAIAGGDESANNRISLLKQFLTRKAGNDVIQKIINIVNNQNESEETNEV